MNNLPSEPPAASLPTQVYTLQIHRRRLFFERFTSWAVFAGAMGVIVATLLIFFYLLYGVGAIFQQAQLQLHASDTMPAPFPVAIDTFDSWLATVRATGELRFTQLPGCVGVCSPLAAQTHALPMSPGLAITAVAQDLPQHTLALGLSDGAVMVIQPHDEATYPVGNLANPPMVIPATPPEITYPLGEAIIPFSDVAPVRLVTYRANDEQRTLAAFTDALYLARWRAQPSLFQAAAWQRQPDQGLTLPFVPTHLVVDDEQRFLYLADEQGFISQYQISPRLEMLHRVRAVAPGCTISVMSLLSGGVSVLVGDSCGTICQWFPIVGEQPPKLHPIRTFHLADAPITALAPEPWRKGFIGADQQGRIGIFYTTSQRTLLRQQVMNEPITHLQVTPNQILVLGKQGHLQQWLMTNPHPEVSWQALWGAVWYENYAQPRKLWQSSAAESVFEPKFSLAPLVVGTLKAALYAMLFAVPVAVLGGIYTGFFMSSRLRQIIKPAMELMGAVPTVVLGLIAGLWLAPIVEQRLPGLIALLLLLPAGVMAYAWGWRFVTAQFPQQNLESWRIVGLVPLIAGLIGLGVALSFPLEQWLFAGNVRLWLHQHGVSIEQRNALVVGMAMGFAVIPTIFTFTEEAVRNVPAHLTTASLALGATAWQTMTRVVLWTASPGIVAAILLGLGRALGETMIVLMASGNTPILSLNPLEGMRTLSANIAIEMPQAQPYSTHFRVLLLSALVLFFFTFIVNTLAESVRCRLRLRYRAL